MTESTHNQPRALAPRKLEQTETLQTLNQWKCVFRNYYRRCQFYGYFLQPNVTWSNETNRGFLTNEASGLKRSPEILASDLSGFLDCLGSYMPFDYVADKLNNESTCMSSVWKIVYEIYDAEIDTSHYLDYANMTKLPEETYRNFFNRLVGFVRQHLPNERIEAEGVVSPNTGESLTIGLLDSIAVHWLLSIDKRLIGIIKTEFAAELKTKRLCQMIKRIASNIDELLQRYSQNDLVNTVTATPTPTPSYATRPPKEVPKSDVDMILRRIERLEMGQNSKSLKQQRFKRSNFTPVTCSHCAFLNKQLGTQLNTKHKTSLCTKKQLSVSLIESMDEYDDNPVSQHSDSDTNEGEEIQHVANSNIRILQNSEGVQQDKNGVNRILSTSPSETYYLPTHATNGLSFTNNISEERCVNNSRNSSNNCPAPLVMNDRKFHTGIPKLNNYPVESESFLVNLCKTTTSSYQWNSVQKLKSPRLQCTLNEVKLLALIDSGAEINVLDSSFAKQANIGIVNTKEVAKAANQLPLDLLEDQPFQSP